MTKMSGNLPFIYDDNFQKIIGVQNPNGSSSNFQSVISITSAALTTLRQNIIATIVDAPDIGQKYQLTDGLLAGKVVEWNGEAFSTSVGSRLVIAKNVNLSAVAVRSGMNPVAWAGSTVYPIGAMITSGGYMYLVGASSGGTLGGTHATVPPVNTVAGTTETNGTVILTCQGAAPTTAVLWVSGAAVTTGDRIYNGNNIYSSTATGTLTTTAPVHTSGTTNNLTWIGLSDLAEYALENVLIPGFLMGKKSSVVITAFFAHASSAITKRIKVMSVSGAGYGVFLQNDVTTVTGQRIQCEMTNQDSYVNQKGIYMVSYGTTTTPLVGSIHNTLADWTMRFTGQWVTNPAPGDAISLVFYSIELVA